jgi:hypothetical protein
LRLKVLMLHGFREKPRAAAAAYFDCDDRRERPTQRRDTFSIDGGTPLCVLFPIEFEHRRSMYLNKCAAREAFKWGFH